MNFPFPSTVLPLVLMAALSVLLPHLLTPRNTLSQPALARSILASAALILLIGAALFAALYLMADKPVIAAAGALPVQTTVYFFQRSALLAPFWGPLLALVWLMRAQGVEDRKGLALAEADRTAQP